MNERNTGRTWIVTLAVTLAAVLAAFGIARLIHSFNSFRMGDFTTLPVSNVEYVQTVDESVVVYDGSTLNRFSSRGDSMWGDGVIIGQNYSVNANDHGVVLWKGNSFSVLRLSDHQNMYSNNLDADIVSARLGSKYLAVLYGEDDNCKARICDMDGRVQDEISFESQVIVDFGFFSDGSLLWVMSMDTTGTVPTCTVTTYRLSRKSMMGSISDGEQVIYHAQFEADNICLVGEEYIKRYDEVGNEMSDKRTLVYGWFLMDVSDGEKPMMVFVPDTQASNTPTISDVRLISGTQDQILRMPFPAHSVFAKGSTLYGFSGSNVMIGSIDSEVMTAYQLPMSVSDVAGVTDDNVAVIDSNNTYYLVALQ